MSLPCHTSRLTLDEGYQVAIYRYGPAPSQARHVLVCVNGGPGLPCDYLRESHKILASEDWCVVCYDQLGCGASDRPHDDALWTLERYVAELEQIRIHLEIGRFHLLGHSWGTWLGTEYCLSFPQRVLSYIAADGAADIPHLVSELQRLRQCLGEQTVSMMTRREADGSIGHPEYQAAITLLNYRHVCRLDDWPAALKASIEGWNMAPYRTIQGPNEFTYTGNMRHWNRLPAMGAITVPALVLAGEYDELPPSCSARMQQAMPNAALKIFRDCSHMPFFERPDEYFAVLRAFLRKAAGA
jgi:proline iminopeptidase